MLSINFRFNGSLHFDIGMLRFLRMKPRGASEHFHWNPIRLRLRDAPEKNRFSFDYFILTLIMFSTFMLILESPLMDPESKKAEVLYWIDVVVTGFFTLELILKVIVYGYIMNGEDSYM